ncbi:hypothetical protein [Paenibacillus turpanensis]|uniref:hypothetical protein n=1 Tax=Paenibacillus turpanensis TaxID=2689078 RepID=UPI001407A8C7|nr:hypothetical protein [Paenibacillus turpanensis]
MFVNNKRLIASAIGLAILATTTAGCNQSASPLQEKPVVSNAGSAGNQADTKAAAASVKPESSDKEEPAKKAQTSPSKETAAAQPAAAPVKEENSAAKDTAQKLGEQASEGESKEQTAQAQASAAPAAANGASQPTQQPSSQPVAAAPEQAQAAEAGTTVPQLEASPVQAGAGGETAKAEPQQQSKPADKLIKPYDDDRTLTFDGLYSKMTVRGMEFSEKLKALDGKEVEMTGYMAPPLTADVTFFVLTKVPMATCPFCSSDADWPADIVVITMPEGEDINPTEHQVKVKGTLSIGSETDENTGFVSLIRIHADKVEVLK